LPQAWREPVWMERIAGLKRRCLAAIELQNTFAADDIEQVDSVGRVPARMLGVHDIHEARQELLCLGQRLRLVEPGGRLCAVRWQRDQLKTVAAIGRKPRAEGGSSPLSGRVGIGMLSAPQKL